MPSKYALFEFFQENLIEIGQFNWIQDYENIHQKALTKETEVIVQWPKSKTALKLLGKKDVDINKTKTERYPAYVLKCGDDILTLRESASRIIGNKHSPQGNKRQKTPNSKYVDLDDEDSNSVSMLNPKKQRIKKKSNDDDDLATEIENELSDKILSSSSQNFDVSRKRSRHSTDVDESQDTIPKKRLNINSKGKNDKLALYTEQEPTSSRCTDVSKARKDSDLLTLHTEQEPHLIPESECIEQSQLSYSQGYSEHCGSSDPQYKFVNDARAHFPCLKEIRHLQAENQKLKLRNDALCQMIDNTEYIPHLEVLLKRFENKLDERVLPLKSNNDETFTLMGRSKSCSHIHSPPSASASPSSTLSMTPSPKSDIEDKDMVTLWPGVTITESQKRMLNMKRSLTSEYTNLLLRMLYKPDVLSKCSLTGKVSNAFQGQKSPKPKLPDIDNVIEFIEQQTKSQLTKIKNSVTSLLNTEGKRCKP